MNNWKKIKIEEVCSFINGYAFDSNKYVQNGIQVIRITNVQKGYISDTDKKFYKEEKELERYKLIEGDLLISLTGNVGRVGVIKSENLPAYLNQRVSCVRIKNNNLLNKRFLFNFLNSDSFEKTCIKNSKGIAQKNISTVWLREIKIPLPAMEEQKEIAARLDAVSDLLAKQKQLLSEQDNLIQSTFYDMFGNPIKNEKGWKFSKISSIYKVRSSQRIHQKDLALSGIPFLRVSDLEKKINCVSPNINLFISDEFFSILHKNRDIPEENDILITTRGTLGDVYIYKNNDRFYFQDGMITWLKPNKNSIMPLFFLYLFKTCEFKNSLHKYKGGTTVAYLSIKNLSDLLIPVPPLELQQKFAAVAEQIESEKSKIKSAIAETQTLFNALMSEYFEE